MAQLWEIPFSFDVTPTWTSPFEKKQSNMFKISFLYCVFIKKLGIAISKTQSFELALNAKVETQL